MICELMTFIASDPTIKYALAAVACAAVGYLLYYCLIWPYMK